MKVRMTTAASLIGALANGVQFSEALQVAITGRGTTPLDGLVPPRYQRLSAILQLPLLACLVAGEVAKVRAAFDGEDD